MKKKIIGFLMILGLIGTIPFAASAEKNTDKKNSGTTSIDHGSMVAAKRNKKKTLRRGKKQQLNKKNRLRKSNKQPKIIKESKEVLAKKMMAAMMYKDAVEKVKIRDKASSGLRSLTGEEKKAVLNNQIYVQLFLGRPNVYPASVVLSHVFGSCKQTREQMERHEMPKEKNPELEKQLCENLKKYLIDNSEKQFKEKDFKLMKSEIKKYLKGLDRNLHELKIKQNEELKFKDIESLRNVPVGIRRA